MGKFIFTTSIIFLCVQWSYGILPCRLRYWTPSSVGQSVPEKSLRLAGIDTDSFIVNTTLNGVSALGTYDKRSEESYFPIDPSSPNVTSSATFDVLGNPEGCITAWAAYSDNVKQYAIPFGTGYIGMTTIANGNYAGVIDTSTNPPKLLVAYRGETRLEENFQVLVSRSDGIKMTLVDAVIEIDPDSNDISAVGSEEIRNGGGVEIHQTFQHRKQIKEVFSNTISRTYTTKSVTEVGWDFLIVGSKYREEHSYTETTTETWTTEKVTDITVTRTISVPAYSSIQACSLVTLKENVEVEYTANAVYYAPGMDPVDIVNILRADSNLDVSIINGQVVKQGVKGTFKGAVALDSAFYIIDITDAGGDCIKAARKNLDFKRQRMAEIKKKIKADLDLKHWH